MLPPGCVLREEGRREERQKSREEEGAMGVSVVAYILKRSYLPYHK